MKTTSKYISMSNSRESTSNKMIAWSMSLFFIYMLLPTVAVSMPQIFRYVFILVFVGLLNLGALLKTQKLNKMIGFNLLAILFILITYYGVQTNALKGLVSYATSTYLFFLPALYAIYINTFKSTTKNTLYILFLLLTTATLTSTFFVNIAYPQASRELAAGGFANSMYVRMNTGGYEFIYGMVVLFPLFIYKYKKANSKYWKAIYIIFICSTVLLAIITEYAIALLLVMFSAIFLLYRPRRTIYNIAILLLLVVLYAIFYNLIINSLPAVSDLFFRHGLNSLSNRVDLINYTLTAGGTSGNLATRLYLYSMSFEVFINNPLFGGLFSPVILGGHSTMLDIAGGSGIFGLFIFISIMWPRFKRQSLLKGNEIYIYSLLSLIVFLVIAFINTVLSSTNISIVLFIVSELIVIPNALNPNPIDHHLKISKEKRHSIIEYLTEGVSNGISNTR